MCIYQKKVCHTLALDLLNIHDIENILLSFASQSILSFHQLITLLVCNNLVAVWEGGIDHAWILRKH